MKAYLTSIGESTTDLAQWALERQGFDVQLVYNEVSSLADKLEYIYTTHKKGDFIRVDADIIVNKNLNPTLLKDLDDDIWWWQFQTFDWYKQDVTYGGVQYIRPEALPALKANIDKFKKSDRPESQMFRLDEFHNPRRCASRMHIMGLHGYHQKDVSRVYDTKKQRNQLVNYDFELALKLDSLCD